MRLQRLLCQSKLDKLLLFHELRVRTVVDDIAPKHRCGKGTIDLLGVDILELSVEDEVVAFDA
jgi:hypothetical protein